MIYLDNNATTPVAPEVLEEMLLFLRDYYANPSGCIRLPPKWPRVTQAREQVVKAGWAHPDEIIFTSCGTESDNTALRAALESNPDRRGVVTTRVEHPAVKNLCEHSQAHGAPRPVPVRGRTWPCWTWIRFARHDAHGGCGQRNVGNNETAPSSPWRKQGASAREAGLCSTPMPQVVGKMHGSCTRPSTCCRYPGTSYTRRRVWVRRPHAGARSSPPAHWAIRNGAVGAGRRTWH